MERVQTAGEVRCLLPAFLYAHIFIEGETTGYEAGPVAHPPRIKPRIGHQERIMEQRGNRRVLAGIREFHLSYF